MNEHEFAGIATAKSKPRVIQSADLSNQIPHTLMLNILPGEITEHVYLTADGTIHSLLYKEPDPSVVSDTVDFLILGHAPGPNGVKLAGYPYAYLGIKCLPESSDAQFCQLIKESRGRPVFLPFSKEAEAQRRAEHGAFSGYTHMDRGIAVKSISKELQQFPGFPDYETQTGLAESVEEDVVSRSAQKLSVPLCEAWGAIHVPRDKASQVLQQARSFLPAVLDMVNADDDELAAELFNAAFQPTAPKSLEGQGYSCSKYFVRIFAKTLVFRKGLNLAALVPVTPEDVGRKGVLGNFKGRPFIAAQHAEGCAAILFSQFGDVEEFVAHGLKFFKMVKPN